MARCGANTKRRETGHTNPRLLWADLPKAGRTLAGHNPDRSAIVSLHRHMNFRPASEGSRVVTTFLVGDTVSLSGTVTRVGDDHQPAMVTVEIEGYWAKAHLTLSADQLDLLSKRSSSDRPVFYQGDGG